MPKLEHSDDGKVDVDGRPRAFAEPHPLGMVYGGGGAFGIAYGAGVAHGLAATGIPVAEAPALGTSAGSWVASAVALGLDYEDFEDVDAPRVPTRRRDTLIRPAREVFGDARHPLVAVSAVCLKSRRRHILDGPGYPSPTSLRPGPRSRGCSLRSASTDASNVDGGMWSATSVDARGNRRGGDRGGTSRRGRDGTDGAQRRLLPRARAALLARPAIPRRRSP